MKIEFKSVEEARSILHALKRTNARNSHGDLDNILDHCENFEARLFDLINKPVETTNEQPRYKFEIVNINATDDPLRVINLSTMEEKVYGVEGLPWKMLRDDQEVMHYIFTNFESDI